MFDTLTDLKTLIAQRAQTTDPKEYDRLTELIVQAEKAESIARAQKQAEQKARLEQERGRMTAEFERIVGEINDFYKSAEELDRQTFEAVSRFCELVFQRLEQWTILETLHVEAENLARVLGVEPPKRKAPSLKGGAPQRLNSSELLTVWLQRYTDKRKLNEGAPPAYEEICEHGFRGGTGLDDYIQRDFWKNF
ncbi:MAG: hypothetical protein HPY45_01855 [Anaerolineae bacterium]|nr:hypothetical protein [Anaerolineae bacterium]